MKQMLLVLVLVIGIASNAYGFPPDSRSLDAEREIMRALRSSFQAPVDGRACDLKPESGRLKVADFFFSYALWSVQKDREGVKKQPSLKCQAPESGSSKYYDCYFSAAEQIRLPGEPEGWSRTLLFKYNPTAKKIVAGSLKCVDVP